MTDQLPDVHLTDQQETRASDLAVQMSQNYWGLRSAARLIVHLQGELDETKAQLTIVEHEWKWAQDRAMRSAKPAHEREPPHCSSCSCPPYAKPKEPSRDLIDYGYAPGSYIITCFDCKQKAWDCNKRASVCKPCAEKRRDRATQPPGDGQ